MASKITFIGAGNMAGAIIGGLIESGVSPSDITATAPNESELAPLAARLGIHTHTDNSAAVSGADVVVLAVKPQIMRGVCEALRESVQQQAILLGRRHVGLAQNFANVVQTLGALVETERQVRRDEVFQLVEHLEHHRGQVDLDVAHALELALQTGELVFLRAQEHVLLRDEHALGFDLLTNRQIFAFRVVGGVRQRVDLLLSASAVLSGLTRHFKRSVELRMRSARNNERGGARRRTWCELYDLRVG